MKRKNNHKLEDIKHNTINAFKNINFKITISVGMNVSNFLDVTVDLANNTYMH